MFVPLAYNNNAVIVKTTTIMWNLLKTIDKNDIAGLIICLSALAVCVKIMYIVGNI